MTWIVVEHVSKAFKNPSVRGIEYTHTCFRQLSEISAKMSLSEDLASSDVALRL